MLVLTRNIGELVYLDLPDGSRIEVKVLEFISGPRVRLGFEAPANIHILRDDAKKKEKVNGPAHSSGAQVTEVVGGHLHPGERLQADAVDSVMRKFDAVSTAMRTLDRVNTVLQRLDTADTVMRNPGGEVTHYSETLDGASPGVSGYE